MSLYTNIYQIIFRLVGFLLSISLGIIITFDAIRSNFFTTSNNLKEDYFLLKFNDSLHQNLSSRIIKQVNYGDVYVLLLEIKNSSIYDWSMIEITIHSTAGEISNSAANDCSSISMNTLVSGESEHFRIECNFGLRSDTTNNFKSEITSAVSFGGM